jgi:uncharacterized protein YggU (UPF0235/DUF167 family)
MEGKANEAVRRAIALAVGVPASAVTLVRGATARRKLFTIAGLTTTAARSLLGG